MRAGEAGDGVEQDYDVTMVFDKALGLFQCDVAYMDVLAGRLIKGAGHYFGRGTGHGDRGRSFTGDAARGQRLEPLLHHVLAQRRLAG